MGVMKSLDSGGNGSFLEYRSSSFGGGRVCSHYGLSLGNRAEKAALILYHGACERAINLSACN